LFILLGLDRFGFNSAQVISGLGLHRVNKSLGPFGFNLGHIEFRVNLNHYSFESVLFRVSSISNFKSKLVLLFLMSVQVYFRVVQFGSIDRVTFVRSSFTLGGSRPLVGHGEELAV